MRSTPTGRGSVSSHVSERPRRRNSGGSPRLTRSERRLTARRPRGRETSARSGFFRPRGYFAGTVMRRYGRPTDALRTRRSRGWPGSASPACGHENADDVDFCASWEAARRDCRPCASRGATPARARTAAPGAPPVAAAPAPGEPAPAPPAPHLRRSRSRLRPRRRRLPAPPPPQPKVRCRAVRRAGRGAEEAAASAARRRSRRRRRRRLEAAGQRAPGAGAARQRGPQGVNVSAPRVMAAACRAARRASALAQAAEGAQDAEAT